MASLPGRGGWGQQGSRVGPAPPPNLRSGITAAKWDEVRAVHVEAVAAILGQGSLLLLEPGATSRGGDDVIAPLTSPGAGVEGQVPGQAVTCQSEDRRAMGSAVNHPGGLSPAPSTWKDSAQHLAGLSTAPGRPQNPAAPGSTHSAQNPAPGSTQHSTRGINLAPGRTEHTTRYPGGLSPAPGRTEYSTQHPGGLSTAPSTRITQPPAPPLPI